LSRLGTLRWALSYHSRPVMTSTLSAKRQQFGTSNSSVSGQYHQALVLQIRNPKPEARSPKQIRISNDPRLQTPHQVAGFGHLCLGALGLFRVSDFGFLPEPDGGTCKMRPAVSPEKGSVNEIHIPNRCSPVGAASRPLPRSWSSRAKCPRLPMFKRAAIQAKGMVVFTVFGSQ
jgi:hypothetical protein